MGKWWTSSMLHLWCHTLIRLKRPVRSLSLVQYSAQPPARLLNWQLNGCGSPAACTRRARQKKVTAKEAGCSRSAVSKDVQGKQSGRGGKKKTAVGKDALKQRWRAATLKGLWDEAHSRIWARRNPSVKFHCQKEPRMNKINPHFENILLDWDLTHPVTFIPHSC